MKLYVLLKDIKLPKADVSYPANYPSFTNVELWVPSMFKPGYVNLAHNTYNISFWNMWKIRGKWVESDFSTNLSLKLDLSRIFSSMGSSSAAEFA